MRALRPIFLVVDIGFVIYWVVSFLGVVPAEFLYANYNDPMMVAWNWSFAPLDLAVSATGLWSLALFRKKDARCKKLALVSLALTSASGFQAISFWAIRGDFDFSWWAPNLFLLLYPWYFIHRFIQDDAA